MTTEDLQSSSPANQPKLVWERLLSMQAALIGATQPDQDYRLLEQTYRESPEYAAMVRRYPLLRSAIKACRHSRLVGNPTNPLAKTHAQPRRAALQWERSHGEN